ncbi:hypothetical protein CEXT_412951 [Caerostris extrusa]|uniref:Uncharacterized protein n=1 Tax=Caerostris extrusa TaxID=172846 RepID=A0AAV4N8E0_CAEEX|nr:hypothetical protein CEXT_412951 [Caerostris extrusa]
MIKFCPELGKFCHNLIPLLDPEGLKNKDDVQLKLKSWYFYCVEYIQRCIENFKDDLVSLLHCALWGNVEVVSENEQIKWDTGRFIETCCMMPKMVNNQDSTASDETLSFTITIVDGKVEVNHSLDKSSYCLKWLDKLKSCRSNDHVGLHNILEGFRLKVVQDLNTLKRLLQKAQTDHYSLYRPSGTTWNFPSFYVQVHYSYPAQYPQWASLS